MNLAEGVGYEMVAETIVSQHNTVDQEQRATIKGFRRFDSQAK